MRNLKTRDLGDIHDRLQVLNKKKEDVGGINSQWFNDTPDIFMGSIPNQVHRKIFIMDHKERSHFCKYPDHGDKYWYYIALRDSEIPLHLNKVPEEYLHIINKRLKGEIKEIPFIQDLVDRKEKINHKLGRINLLIGMYRQILIDYLYDNRPYNKYDTTKLIFMNIKGHDYLFETSGGKNIRILDEYSIEKIQI